MKILIKSTTETYQVLKNKNYNWHSCCYYPFLFYECFRKLGHYVRFYGNKKARKVTTNFNNFDVMLWCEIPSYGWDKEESLKILKNFKGRNVFYIPTTYDLGESGKYFNYIFVTEVEAHKAYYKRKFPKSKVLVVPWISPEFEFIDKNNQDPYYNSDFKIIYIGIIKDRYLKVMSRLAEKGEKIYLGGTYFKDGEKLVRRFSETEIKNLHPNIKLISSDGTFAYGYHWNWLKYADLGLNFYPAPDVSLAVSSKITDYLVCGLSTISEHPAPNNFRLKELQGGQVVQWNNVNHFYELIQKEKQLKRDKTLIKQKAREIFDPIKTCKEIIKIVK